MGIRTSIDMASALHPQTILALDFDGQPSRRNGEHQCGFASHQARFKSANELQAIEVDSHFPGGFWEKSGLRTGFRASAHGMAGPFQANAGRDLCEPLTHGS